MRVLVLAMVVSLSGLLGLAAPAQASCSEVGDPSCTVGAWAGAALCTAQEVAKGGANKQDIADCFTQPTGP